MSQYYYTKGATEVFGPIWEYDLIEMYQSGELPLTSKIRSVQDEEWYFLDSMIDVSRKQQPEQVPRKSELLGYGVFLSLVGIAISLYFLIFYETSVSVSESGSYISGIGNVGAFHGSVNNIGLMHNQEIGLICGSVILIIGVILAVGGHLKAEK